MRVCKIAAVTVKKRRSSRTQGGAGATALDRPEFVKRRKNLLFIAKISFVARPENRIPAAINAFFHSRLRSRDKYLINPSAMALAQSVMKAVFTNATTARASRVSYFE